MAAAKKEKGPAIVNASGPAGVPKLVSKLPSDTVNGLPTIAQKLVDDPTERFLCVVELDTMQAVQDVDTGMVVPYVRLRKLEVIFDPDDAERVRLALKKANEVRLGKTPLEGLDDLMDTDASTDWHDPDDR